MSESKKSFLLKILRQLQDEEREIDEETARLEVVRQQLAQAIKKKKEERNEWIRKIKEMDNKTDEEIKQMLDEEREAATKSEKN